MFYFRVLNFRRPRERRNVFNGGYFPIYGTDELFVRYGHTLPTCTSVDTDNVLKTSQANDAIVNKVCVVCVRTNDSIHVFQYLQI